MGPNLDNPIFYEFGILLNITGIQPISTDELIVEVHTSIFLKWETLILGLEWFAGDFGAQLAHHWPFISFPAPNQVLWDCVCTWSGT